MTSTILVVLPDFVIAHLSAGKVGYSAPQKDALYNFYYPTNRWLVKLNSYIGNPLDAIIAWNP